MNDQTSTLLDVATRDLGPDVGALVAGGMARGRARRRRRAVGTTLVAAAVAGVAGVGVLATLAGDEGAHAKDPTSFVSRPAASTAPDHPDPRQLGTRAAGVPDVFASIFPGDVAVIPGKENPMDGFDPRSQPIGGQTGFPQSEPGPGVIADFTWNGFYLRAAVAPSDPAFGDTARQRCRGEAAGGDAVCEDVAGGGALVSSTMVNSPEDGTTTVRYVEYYTPDLWTVTLMVSNGATSRGHVLAPQPPFTLAELTAAATSDAWFE